jgi:LacI family transcriptional regulator
MEIEQRVTLRDIAKVAGLHFTTVGLALRNDPRINAATTAKVQDVARRLGYSHDAMLSALSTYRHRKSQRLAGVIAHLTTYPLVETFKVNTRERATIEAATAYARSQGFGLESFQLNAPGMTAARLSRMLRARGIQGVIFAPRLPMPGPMPDLEWQYFSPVAIGYSITNLAVHRACPHQAHNMQLCLRELRRRGYRRTGVIMPHDVNERTRGNALGAFLAQQQQQTPADRVAPLFEEEITKPMIATWLRAERIDSVILTSTPLIHLAWIRALGYDDPEKLGITVLSRAGDTEHLAGIDEQMNLLGESAAKFVTSLLRHNERGLPDYPRYSLVEGRWVDRPSVRALPAAGDSVATPANAALSTAPAATKKKSRSVPRRR